MPVIMLMILLGKRGFSFQSSLTLLKSLKAATDPKQILSNIGSKGRTPLQFSLIKNLINY